MTKVHFRVDFDWLTQHCRGLWAEGSFYQALETLESAGVPTSHSRQEIIRGNLKMIQDPDGIEGITGMLAEDNWRPDLNRCHLSEYPDPDIVDEVIEERRQEKLDKETEQIKTLVRSWNTHVKYPDEERLETIKYVFKNISEEAFTLLGYDKEELISNYYHSIDEPYRTNFEKNIKKTEDWVKDQVRQDKELDDLKIDYKLEHDHGFIAPNGDFYGCIRMNHGNLAVAILDIIGVDNSEWISGKRRSQEVLMEDYNYLMIGSNLEGEFEITFENDPTDEQVETAENWARKYNMMYAFDNFMKWL